MALFRSVAAKTLAEARKMGLLAPTRRAVHHLSFHRENEEQFDARYVRTLSKRGGLT